MKKIIIYICILSLGFALRYYQLVNFPEGVHVDEASVGYNAYSVAKTGKDQYGNYFPAYFLSEKDYKLPVHIYITSLFVWLLGLSRFTVKLVPCLMGVGVVVLAYHIYSLLTNSKRYSLLASFLTAVSPWLYVFSRGSTSLEVMTSIFFACLSFIFFLKYIKRNIARYLILWFLFNIISILTYRTASIFVCLFYPLTIIYLKFVKQFTQKQFHLLLLMATIQVAVFLVYSSVISQRFSSVNVFNSNEFALFSKLPIVEDGAAGRSVSNIFISRVFHNKLVNTLIFNQRQFWKQFDPGYLFFKGFTFYRDGNDLLFANEINLYFFEIILIIAAVAFASALIKRNKLLLLPFLWIIISHFPSGFAVDSQNTGRTALAVIGYAILISLGIKIFHEQLKGIAHKIFDILLILAYGYFISFGLHQFYFHDPVRMPWVRNYGIVDLVQYIENNKQHYKKVVFGKDIYTLYAYLAKIDPVLLQKKMIGKNDLVMENLSSSFTTDDSNCNFENGKVDALYVCFGRQIPVKSKIIKVFRFRDGQPNYVLLEYDPTAKIEDRNKIILPQNVEFY